MENILKQTKTTIILLTIVAMAAVVFYYAQSQNQGPIEPVQAQSATYYVDGQNKGGNGCDDNWAGTQENPWCTIQKAVNSLSAGDTGIIRGGTYNEYVEIGIGAGADAANGTSENSITLRGATNETVTLEQKDATTDRIIYISAGGNTLKYWIFDNLTFSVSHAWYHEEQAYHNLVVVYGADYLTFENSNFLGNDIDQGEKSGWALGLHGWEDYITINNNYFGGFYSSADQSDNMGVMMTGNAYKTHIYITNNTFEGLSGDGVHLIKRSVDDDPSASYILIQDNVFTHVYPGLEENAIDLKGVDHVIIKGNTMSGYDVKPAEGSLGTAVINHFGYVDGFIIEDNVVYDSGVAFYLAPEAAPQRNLIFRNNVIYDMDEDKGGGRGLTLGYFNGAKIYNNVIAHTTNNALLMVGAFGNDKVEFLNNIIYISSGWTYQENQYPYAAELIDDALIGKNIFYDSTGETFIYYYPDDSTYIGSDLATLKANIPSQAIGSITSDPKFNNPSTNPLTADYTLASDSPGIDAGEFLTTVLSNDGTGTEFVVDDSLYFSDGFGLIDGDTIVVGADTVVISNVDYDTDTITVTSSFTWKQHDNVSLPYVGNSPDLGAYEYQPIQQTCLPPDLNCDQQIDAADLTAFKNLWGQTDSSADFNQDSFINTQDFGIIMSKWGNY